MMNVCAFNLRKITQNFQYCVLFVLILCAPAKTQRSEREVRIILTRRDTNNFVQNSLDESGSRYCNLCCINIQSNIVGKHCGSHTLCKYPVNISGPSCKGFLPIRFSFMEQEAIVDMHNTVRSNVSNGLEMRSSVADVGQPTAANMRAMQWSTELANVAERWVAQCIFSNDICRDLERFPVGQNIGRGNLAQSNELKLIRKWQNEVSYFEPSHVAGFKSKYLGKHKISSYTQIVWADTYLIGCARAIFQKSRGPNIYYWSHLICNYGPTGNIPNQPIYKVGPPCSACPEGTTCSIEWHGLCSSENNEDLFDYVDLKMAVASSTESIYIKAFINLLAVFSCGQYLKGSVLKMMSELIIIPLKKPSEVDLAKPLTNLFQSRYSTSDEPKDFSRAIDDFSKLRNTAIWRAFEKYDSSLEIVYGYYDQIVALETKIPIQELQVPFKWKNAFDKGSIFGSRTSLTISSLAYEKICVLFNIASLQSAVGATQSLDNDEGLKFAAKLFQQSAGIYSHLKSIVMQTIQQDPTPDLTPDTLDALSAIMLMQAQEIFVHKAIHDNMKDQITAKLAAQCDDLCGEALRFMQKEGVKEVFDKGWIAMVSGKQSGFKAVAEFYQSLVCRNDKSVGEEIARLEHTIEQFKISQSVSGKPLFDDIYNKAQRNLAEAKKDNDFIYHARVPDTKSLAPVGKAQLAKLILPGHPLSKNFRDLFFDLVPVAIHQALAAYDVRKQALVNQEIHRMRESTQILNSTLASLNLPAAIESTEGNTLPPSLLEKAHAIREAGGVNKIQKLIDDLPDSLQRNREILDEADRLLTEEEQTDKKLREQFKDKWCRTPSETLNGTLKNNSYKYRQYINTALSADEVVNTKFDKHRTYIELLSRSPEEIRSNIPTGTNSNLSGSAVQELRQLMEEVGTLKAARDVIESEMKSATVDMKNLFTAALAKDGAIAEPEMSVEGLGKTFGPLQKQVKENIEKQEGLIQRIQAGHAQFVSECGAEAGGRESMMSNLAAAHNAFNELVGNLEEGTKFYNDLTPILLQLQNKISDFGFARKTEKEELLKDLTQESSRSSSAGAPSVPAYMQNPDAKREPPPRPPAPASAPTPTPTQGPSQGPPPAVYGSLPYPVYVQGMPVPYGASSSIPYPSYAPAPTPMPAGYNPYATMPYPSSYNYPGGFPQMPQNPNYPQNPTYPPNPNYSQSPHYPPQ